VHIDSEVAHRPPPGRSAHATAKSAQIVLTRPGRSDLHEDERAADDQLCQGGGDRRPASSPVWTYCFMVNATSAMPHVTQPGVREHLVSAAATPLEHIRQEEISGAVTFVPLV